MAADFGVLECTGRDAEAFLQSQLATDLRTLDDGAGKPAALLAANGRVLASGMLLKRDASHFGWVLHDSLLPNVRDHLRRFVLRSKLALEMLPELRLVPAEFAEEAWPAWRDPAGRALGLATAATAATLPEFALMAIRAGWVDCSARLADRFLAQMLDLHRHGAVALDKGCYPGQEIVARTHYLGRVKRGLRRLCIAAAPKLDAALHDASGKAVGDWLHAVPDGAGWQALAVVDTSADTLFGETELGPQPAQSQTILAPA